MGIHQNVPGAHVPKLNMYADNYANGLDLGSPTLHGHGMGDGLNGGSNGIHQNSSVPLNGQHPTHPHGTALTNEAGEHSVGQVHFSQQLWAQVQLLSNVSKPLITTTAGGFVPYYQLQFLLANQ